MRTALRAARIPRLGRGPAQLQLADHEWLRRRYLQDGASIQQIATELGCHPRALRRALGAADLAITPGNRSRYEQLRDHQWLHHRYSQDGVTLDELATQIGCSIAAVRRALTAANITPPSPRPPTTGRGSMTKPRPR